MNREDDGLVEQIVALQRRLDDLKTLQYTSQESGMQFKDITPVSGFVDIVVSQGYGETWLVTNKFKPDHDRPAICIPHMTLQTSSAYTFEWDYNYFLNLESAIIYDSNHNFVGSVDAWHFMHRRGTTDGSYAWQSIFYTWGSVNTDIKVTISLRATDTGTHTIQIESAEQ